MDSAATTCASKKKLLYSISDSSPKRSPIGTQRPLPALRSGSASGNAQVQTWTARQQRAPARRSCCTPSQTAARSGLRSERKGRYQRCEAAQLQVTHKCKHGQRGNNVRQQEEAVVLHLRQQPEAVSDRNAKAATSAAKRLSFR